MRWGKWAVLAVPLVVAACGGGPTAREKIAEMKPKVDAIRATLVSSLSTLPTPGEIVSVSVEPVDPKPTYELKDGGVVGNTAFLSVEEIKDGGKPAFDLVLSSDLAYALSWTGPKNPMAESVLDEPAEDLGKTFDRALATPYVVVYRAVSYDPAVATDEKNFSGGTVDLEAFLVTASDGKAKAACRIQAESSTELSYSYKPGEDPKERLAAFAESTLWEDARKKLAACLVEKTGGTFTFG